MLLQLSYNSVDKKVAIFLQVIERPILNNEQDDAALVAGGRGRGRGWNRSVG